MVGRNSRILQIADPVLARTLSQHGFRLLLRVVLAQPRGFCAGVVRAIDIVERALEKYGQPVYVRHEIVHNQHVVDGLKKKGAHFVEELQEIPDGAVTVFSAHGVPQSVVLLVRLPTRIMVDTDMLLIVVMDTTGGNYAFILCASGIADANCFGRRSDYPG